MKYTELFRNSKPVIAMLHLKGDAKMTALERAQQEFDQFMAAGVEAVLVENYFGSAKDCEAVLAWLHAIHPDALYGVNILGNFREAFRLAKLYGAKFIQIDSVCGHLRPEEEPAFLAELQALRADSEAVLLGGVRFKYQPLRSGRTLEQDLQLGRQRCDAIVVTGEGTGMATPLAKTQAFRRTLGSFPLVVGAGVTIETLPETFAHGDGAIVGSYFKQHHRADCDLSTENLNAFMAAKRQCV